MTTKQRLLLPLVVALLLLSIPFASSAGYYVAEQMPAGTVATASSSWYLAPPSNAIDGNPGTGWNSATHWGQLTLRFPVPVTFNGLRFVSDAWPFCTETYTLEQSANGVDWSPLITVTPYITRLVTWDLSLPASTTCQYLRITIPWCPSWVAIHEISLLVQVTPAAIRNVHESLIANSQISQQVVHTLEASLQAAEKHDKAGKIIPAVNEIDAYLNKVNAAVKSGKLSAEVGNQLIQIADAYRSALEARR